MSITVANTANTNTFDYWRNRTNELADAMTNKTVTVDSNTATGNAVVNGHFVSGTLVANVALRGGNTSTFNTLIISSNVEVSTGNTITVGNSTVNTFLNGSTLVIGNTDSNVTSNSSTLTIGNSSIFTSINSTEIKLGNSIVNVTINSTSLDSSNTFTFATNSAVTVPIGTTAQRPSGAVGQIRYNTDESKYEVYVGGAFNNVVTESEQLKVYDVSDTQVFP